MFQSQAQSASDQKRAVRKGALGEADWLCGYPSGASAFDEFLGGQRKPRPHYAGLFDSLQGLGRAEFKRRQETCGHLVQEQGITYNVYGDPRGMERPWQLDPLPLVIAPDEWALIEAGLIQRAILLNRILADCYGAQELIRSGWLSPALVFAQPAFLRPCHGVIVPRDLFLYFYGADLARSPDGRWWVVSDRTQIPTGAGYALANRLITSRILPEPFRDQRVRRLAGFFRDAQSTLSDLADRPSCKGRVVILTPGPHNETYFEQAYLARYLGYMLVEGQDLTVRDNEVFLKTLGGLERVDVILRRVDDDFCDPLELRNDSMLGVPGLVEVVRAGNVVMANALGSGLVQSPAFMPFLPGLCKHLLGEELKLPSVATWWCGQQAAQKYVCEHLGDLNVRPAFPARPAAADTDQPMSAAECEDLRRRIQFDPDLFVAQERVGLSTSPTWDGAGLTASPIGLRVFLAASGRGYSVMPGGLTRVSPEGSGRVVSLQRGGASKDTWVLSETPVEEVSLLHRAGQTIELRRTGNNLPSRLADNFYWLGRYAERADATGRLLRSALRRFNPERTGSAMPLLAPLLKTLEVQGQLPGVLGRLDLRQNPEAFEAELLAAIFDPSRGGSLHNICSHLHQLAMHVRDRTSNDMWRVISQINQRLATPASSLAMLAGDATQVLTETLLGLSAFQGLARENMTRAQAWRFLDMGLRLERAIYLCTLLDATLLSDEAEDQSVLEAVLEVADSSITYRSRYSLLALVPPVFDLILLDDKNPRSVLFQLRQFLKHIEKLPGQREGTAGAGRTLLLACTALLERADARELAQPPEKWPRSQVASAIRATLHALPEISNTLAAIYFAHSTISRTGRENSP